ncbi:hypothetical protein J2857_006131 [Neorhizobium galegae]|nr:hypothetical protein [Neorhizobium galegae]
MEMSVGVPSPVSNRFAGPLIQMELEDENSLGTILIVVAVVSLSTTGLHLGVLDKVVFADWF